MAEGTLVSACTACANRSKGSRVGIWLEGVGELGSGMLGGPVGMHIIWDRNSVCEVVLC